MLGTTQTMTVCRLTADGRFVYEDRAVPAPAPGEVLVRVAYVGICGSDLHFHRHGRVGSEVIDSSLVLGHEFSGTIAACGEGVAPGRLGQSVSVEPQQSCRRCETCVRGDYHLCPDVEFFGAPPVDGALAEFIAVRDEVAHLLPAGVALLQGALIEPLSVGLHAARKAAIRGGERVLVTGAGPIGVLAARAAKALGAGEVAVSDPLASRRERALGLGIGAALSPEDVDGAECDVYLDASGHAGAVASGLRALRASGRAVLIGVGAESLEIDPDLVRRRELMITGVFRYCGTWPAALRLVNSEAISLDGMVSEVFPLSAVDAAFAAAESGEAMKVLVKVGGGD